MDKEILDVRGEICPYPMLKTNEQLDANIKTLTVITDHAPTLMTIPPQAVKRGYSCDIEETSQGEWTLYLTKE
jgi:TusA-related sulfurtransferase